MVLTQVRRHGVRLVLGILGLGLVLAFLYNSAGWPLLRQEIRYYPSIKVDSHHNTQQAPSFEAPSNETTHHGLARKSRLHYLVPASDVKASLCAGVASALANGYPIPRIVGYKGKGEFNARAAHIAKLRAIQRYLDNVDGIIPGHAAEDDLVMVVDGYDVLAKLPAGVAIERYFELVEAADQKLASRRGITVPELRSLGLQQTLLFGTDKGCFPPPATDPRCWLVPYSDLPPYVWGPKSKREEHGRPGRPYTDSRFLNSGTVIGPLGDLRKFVNATLEYIQDNFNPENRYRNSDQFYAATLYARQEFQRLVDLGEGRLYIDVKGDLPKPRSGPEDETEYHLFVDTDYALVQTRCCNEQFMQKLQYRPNDLRATVTTDPFDDYWHFQQFDVQMPMSVFQGLVRLYETLPEDERPSSSAKGWISSLQLDTDVATQHIFPIYHHTCGKADFVEIHRKSWYFPLIEPLMRSARAGNEMGKPLHPRLIDGRQWIAPQQYPRDAQLHDELGGVFTDLEKDSFFGFRDFCKKDLAVILGDPPVS
ncbi:hypothetical protein S40285_05817 [Stachybotrys chlorohalonatus IBT 40285]|uniref:Uncharacterized protein n=1 Tax=Stachybotrys chlorohalonatus (strain IBT 40285) TaxID=1283841 RepID=A0A084QF35_STAC4|nr:hypothetical protein S40285_05817 [Stachybotrys chlorohalonata IBT 40285]